MNPADFIDELRKRCDLCHRQPKEVREDADRDVYHVVCNVCGRYAVTQDVLWRFGPVNCLPTRNRICRQLSDGISSSLASRK